MKPITVKIIAVTINIKPKMDLSIAPKINCNPTKNIITSLIKPLKPKESLEEMVVESINVYRSIVDMNPRTPKINPIAAPFVGS
jgi:hypothetical protein